MRRLTLLLACLLTFCHANAQQPSLGETIAFMNRDGSPEGHPVTSNGGQCKIGVQNSQRQIFSLPTGTTSVEDGNGKRHLEFTWTVFQDRDSDMAFDLSTIDPTSIKTDVAFSPAFIQAHHPVQPSDMSNADLTILRFTSRDKLPSISAMEFELNHGEVSFQSRYGAFLIFRSRASAEVFVTAFVHAIELCGGRPNSFQPTPTKPSF